MEFRHEGDVGACVVRGNGGTHAGEAGTDDKDVMLRHTEIKSRRRHEGNAQYSEVKSRSSQYWSGGMMVRSRTCTISSSSSRTTR